MLFLNIIYVLLAIAMIALILMQRGAGAQAAAPAAANEAARTKPRRALKPRGPRAAPPPSRN